MACSLQPERDVTHTACLAAGTAVPQQGAPILKSLILLMPRHAWVVSPMQSCAVLCRSVQCCVVTPVWYVLQPGRGNERWKQLATLQLILGMLRDPEPQLTLAGKIWLDSLCCATLHAVLCTMLCCGTYTQACVLCCAMLCCALGRLFLLLEHTVRHASCAKLVCCFGKGALKQTRHALVGLQHTLPLQQAVSLPIGCPPCTGLCRSI